MVFSATFKTRARALDHLGREQIADGPTAVSELWKNAYDAYARNVELNIFDSLIPTATIVDDGHGMNRRDFEDRWLVIGTESKFRETEISREDQNGLAFREKQGQKGIGRLSSASLAPVLMILSKRRDEPFVAALVDWRLFENPYLLMQDVQVPVVEFDEIDEFPAQFEQMRDTLIGNAWGDDEDQGRDERLKSAWDDFGEYEAEQGKPLTRKLIEETAVNLELEDRFLESWPVWTGKSETGTALLLAGLTYDLRVQLRSDIELTETDTAIHARKRLKHTLSSFTDFYTDEKDRDAGLSAGEFDYGVYVWAGEMRTPVITSQNEVGINELSELEHVIDGKVDMNGVFRGKVKAFGEWQKGIVTIKPSNAPPNGPSTVVGPFNLRFGAFEPSISSTTLDRAVHTKFKQMAEDHGGLMVYRDGLRVLPFGREDNDFFEIELRRNMHAGRAFWAARRMFGRIALKRSENPNLKDKAGREGLIDNQAAKAFRDIVVGILKQSARLYFGTAAETRKEKIGDIKRKKSAEKAEEERKKFLRSRRKLLRDRLERATPEIGGTVSNLEKLEKRLLDGDLPEDPEAAFELHSTLMRSYLEVSENTIDEVPDDLGNLEEPFRDYRDVRQRALALAASVGDKLFKAVEEFPVDTRLEVVKRSINFRQTDINRRLKTWQGRIEESLKKEIHRIKEISNERQDTFAGELLHFQDEVKMERLPVADVLREIDSRHIAHMTENADFFEPYLLALDALKESIDIGHLVSFGMDQVSELRSEIDRLNELAQLGIAVEIIGHELEDLDIQVRRGLKAFPSEVKKSDTFKAVNVAHEQLTDRFRFLQPMKLSGDRPREMITGRQLADYCISFFERTFEETNITVDVTDAFEAFSISEQPARLYPVFINLVNNAQYWVRQGKQADRTIRFDVSEKKVIIADTGPGVDELDLRHLFSLFFTRKARGGRGVGLYLCRANLAAGGHSIEYVVDENDKILPGANFAITFHGGKYA